MTNVRYGLCCIHLDLNDWKFQTMTRKRYLDLGNAANPAVASRARNNIKVTMHTAADCLRRGWVYRVSSGLVPLATLPQANFTLADLDLGADFDAAAAVVRKGVRISNHPDQFNVLASENTDAVAKTVRELDMEADIMSRLGAEHNYNSPMNIHLNCSKGDIQDIANRFVNNLELLGSTASSRLVLENEDKGIWTVENLYKYIYLRTGTPITFDYLHHKCNPGTLSEQQAFELAASTWHGYRPLFHYSETMPQQNNPRKHAEYSTATFCTYGVDVDVDMELKMKNRAIDRHIKMEQSYATV